MKNSVQLFIVVLSITFICQCNSLSAQFTKLMDFAGASSGQTPLASLYSDGTFLYGTTIQGGVNNLGTLFKIEKDGTGYLKLLDFEGASNGLQPRGSLISDGIYLYGTTELGGDNDLGTIFKIKKDGTNYTKLFDFDGNGSGYSPQGSLFADDTYLYGTTQYGGGLNGDGAVFRIKLDGTEYQKILELDVLESGSYPLGSLVSDGSFLYGMTSSGGSNQNGTVFKVSMDGTEHSVLVDFDGLNGRLPKGSLMYDGTFLYGMTSYGGINDRGVIFKLNTDGTGFINLLDFDGANGWSPLGDLLLEGEYLFGMSSMGSTNGNIFKIKNDGTDYQQLYGLNGTSDGRAPKGSLISDSTYLYGLTSEGGMNNFGTIFKFQHVSTTDISTVTGYSNVTISPNPSKDFILLNSGNSIGLIQFYNSLGQKVKEINLNKEKQGTISVSELSKGIYFVKHQDSNSTLRFIKN